MPDHSFDSFMQQRRRVAAAFVNGDPNPLGEISTASNPATIFGPSGGAEQGARRVLQVNEAASHRFQGGTTELEILHSGESGDLAYWTGFQRASVHVEGGRDPVPMKLRVTEVFRRENGEWKLVHRHADPLSEPRMRH
jgi:ketosteroid isomerase-like protein